MAVGGSGYSRETGRKWRWEAVGTAGRQAGSGGGRQWVQPGDRQEVAVGGSGYTCTGAVDESSVAGTPKAETAQQQQTSYLPS